MPSLLPRTKLARLGMIYGWFERLKNEFLENMATIVNWSHDKLYKLISLWSEDVIQEPLEGCYRNSQVYKKIADSLREAGFYRTFEQCREKMKKLKAEYKKVKDKHEETGQGCFPEWEFYDALDAVVGQKHSTEPPVVIESMPTTSSTEIVLDDKTQDISGAVDPDVCSKCA